MQKLCAGTMVFGIVAFGACAEGQNAPPQTGPDTKREPERPSAATLQRVAMIATGKPLSDAELRREMRSMDAGSWNAGEFIDGLLEDPGVARQLARTVFKRNYTHTTLNLPYQYTLSKVEGSEDSQRAIYYLREPCDPADALEVRPWWSPDHEVRVCPEAYKPSLHHVDVKLQGASRPTRTSCSSMLAYRRESTCGCGPYLARCYESTEQRRALERSMVEEVERLVWNNVSERKPIADLFLTNATFRDRNVEFLYRRWQVEAGGKPDFAALSRWPEEGQWAKRPETARGQHAGVLTTPKILYHEASIRQRMKSLYQIVWCIKPLANGANPEDVLSLPGSDLQIANDGWRELAARPLCTNCHARLDHGARFWSGYRDMQSEGEGFDASFMTEGHGKLYARNIEDPRGAAVLTPNAWGKLVTSQPEFGRCMAENIVSYILGDHAHEGDGRRFYRLYTERPFFRDMLKAALLLHLERSVGSAAVAASGSEPRDPVDVIAALTGRYCLACHDGSIEELPNLDGDPIPREHGLSVLNAVAFEAMPKHPVVMEEHARRELVSALIAWMWPNDQLARRTARNYYGRENQPRTVQAIANALSLVRHTAGATAEDGLSWEHAEGGITPEEARFTPGFAALVGLEAVDACRDRSEPQSAAFQKCLERALQLEVLFR